MSSLITWEWQYFVICAMWGMVLSVVYDGIRIFRRVFIHRKVFLLAVEDIIFWTISGFVIFHVTFMINNGIIRGFALMAFVIGSAMYQYSISWIIVKYVPKPLKKLTKLITMGLKKLIALWKSCNKKREESYEKIRNKKREREKIKKTENL